MNVLDYGRSFVQGTGEGTRNAPRFWVESRTLLVDERRGETEEFLQCGACKAEILFLERGLFQNDSHDFTPVFGPKHTLIFRRKAYLNERYRVVTPADDPWRREARLREASPVQELTDAAAVQQAVRASLPIVVHIELAHEALGLRAIVECPVKTMNVDTREGGWQVDTGPVAWPDLSRRLERLVDTLALAFVVLNAPGYVETVSEAPTDLPGAAGMKVHHYARIEGHTSRNRLFAAGLP